jgi:hypothetical protein
MALGRAAGASVTIRNAGNRGISIPQDTEYETLVTLDFGKGAEIIGSLRITKTEPRDLDVTVAMDKGKVVLEPVLLNPGQSVSIFALLTNFKERVRVIGHIQGAKIKYVQSDKGMSPSTIITAILFGGTCRLAGFGYLLYVSKGGDVQIPLTYFTVVAGVATIFGMGFVILAIPAFMVVFTELTNDLVYR